MPQRAPAAMLQAKPTLVSQKERALAPGPVAPRVLGLPRVLSPRRASSGILVATQLANLAHHSAPPSGPSQVVPSHPARAESAARARQSRAHPQRRIRRWTTRAGHCRRRAAGPKSTLMKRTARALPRSGAMAAPRPRTRRPRRPSASRTSAPSTNGSSAPCSTRSSASKSTSPSSRRTKSSSTRPTPSWPCGPARWRPSRRR
mmetsp:Transcript_6629/g.16914  ORF Transcript_6629/g.16914 Transcript_6629/m.16914 type:complete len:203 (+) Transcript_6629:380-988(+)